MNPLISPLCKGQLGQRPRHVYYSCILILVRLERFFFASQQSPPIAILFNRFFSYSIGYGALRWFMNTYWKSKNLQRGIAVRALLSPTRSLLLSITAGPFTPSLVTFSHLCKTVCPPFYLSVGYILSLKFRHNVERSCVEDDMSLFKRLWPPVRPVRLKTVRLKTGEIGIFIVKHENASLG